MKLHAQLLFVAIIISCGGSDDPGLDEVQLSAPTSLNARDVANQGDASDLELSYQKPDELSLIQEFRVFLVKSTGANSFDSLDAFQLSSDRYLHVDVNADGDQLSFKQNHLDTDGDPIQENIDYNFFVLSVGTEGSEVILSAPSNTIKLEQKSAVRTLTDSFNAGSGGMDVDADGNIYMGDFGAALGGSPGRRVYKITPEGQVSTFANGLLGASGNDFDNEGNLYQSSIQGGTLSKITPDGEVSTFASGFQGPVGVAFDGTSNFYVCNCSNNTISKVDMNGNVSLFSSSALLACPNGIDIDQSGNLYIANFNSSRIVKITPAGTASTFAVMSGNNMGHLLIGGNFIYVVARGLNSIYRVSFQGQVSLFAGNGTRGLANGSLDQATFSLPNDMAFSPDGKKIYINDVASFDAASTGIISPVVIRVIDII